MREQPVVVKAAAVLPILNLDPRRLVAGEVLDRRLNRRAIGFGDFDEDSVHVEDEQVLHHIRSNSSRTRWACSRVPTVMRTPPGIS